MSNRVVHSRPSYTSHQKEEKKSNSLFEKFKDKKAVPIPTKDVNNDSIVKTTGSTPTKDVNHDVRKTSVPIPSKDVNNESLKKRSSSALTRIEPIPRKDVINDILSNETLPEVKDVTNTKVRNSHKEREEDLKNMKRNMQDVDSSEKHHHFDDDVFDTSIDNTYKPFCEELSTNDVAVKNGKTRVQIAREERDRELLDARIAFLERLSLEAKEEEERVRSKNYSQMRYDMALELTHTNLPPSDGSCSTFMMLEHEISQSTLPDHSSDSVTDIPQYDIEFPHSPDVNIVTLTTELLFKQHERDACSPVPKQINLIDIIPEEHDEAEASTVANRKENLFKQYDHDFTAPVQKEPIMLKESQSEENTSEPSSVGLRKENLFKQYKHDLLPPEQKQPINLNDEFKTSEGDTVEDCNGGVKSDGNTSEPSSVVLRKEHLFKQYKHDLLPPEQKQPINLNEEFKTSEGDTVADCSISSRKENLRKRYEHDMLAPVPKQPIILIEGNTPDDASDGNEGGGSILKRTESLHKKYLFDMAKFTKKESVDDTNIESLGSHMNRYVAVTRGETVDKVDDEEEEVDGQLNVDQQGVVIEKSGGKIEIVKSSDSISDIKSKFGGSHKWKKEDTETPLEEVDKMKVDSARSVFKEKETKKEENTMFNRPTSKKVRDPKELMDIRKKATYGQEDESEDGVVHKSVEIEKEQVDPSCKKNALNMYKNLEKKEENKGPLQKPKTRLLTDMEARASMEGIRSISSSASEASDVNETANDLTLDTVSGYGSAAPCSPSSTFSEDYLSDTKETSKVDELKEVSPVILPTDDEPILTIEAKIETNGIDDSSLLINGHIDEPSVVDEAVPVNTEFV